MQSELVRNLFADAWYPRLYLQWYCRAVAATAQALLHAEMQANSQALVIADLFEKSSLLFSALCGRELLSNDLYLSGIEKMTNTTSC